MEYVRMSKEQRTFFCPLGKEFERLFLNVLVTCHAFNNFSASVAENLWHMQRVLARRTWRRKKDCWWSLGKNFVERL
jgi:hypothetical protein